MQISLSPIQKRSIEIYGVVGTFIVPGSGIRTHHFSTLASAREPNTHAEALLRELKPMRERVNASELRDLDALIQRDLNDARVAHELVPYLKGATPSGVAFFPAVLAALIPKGFISGQGAPYPTPQPDPTDDARTHYGEGWTIESFRSDTGDLLPLGRLTVYPADTDVIVLDGQHRANAFRYVSGVYAQDDTLYSAFYEGEEPLPVFEADLPVTLVWFESTNGEVRPDYISRNLFVDVNTTAKRVNRSRSILLDDRRVSSFVTRFFLSSAAKASFDPAVFSLLHSGFDLDSEIVDGAGHALTLTNPDLLEYSLSWLLFGSRRFHQLNFYRVSAEWSRKNVAAFEEVFDAPDFNRTHLVPPGQTDDVIVREPEGADSAMEQLGRFEKVYERVLHPALDRVFSGFSLFQQHYAACETVAAWCSTRDTDVREVWKKVFCGGEGLYYTLRYYAAPGRTPTPRVSVYLSAVRQIEAEFRTERAARFGPASGAPEEHERRVNRAYDAMRTRAFHVGLFLALDEWSRRRGLTLSDASAPFVDRLNERTFAQWLYILNELKQAVVPNVDPKDWPAYQKLLLRVLQEPDEFYKPANYDVSPDGRIFAGRVTQAFVGWVEANEDVDPRKLTIEHVPADLLQTWAFGAKDAVETLFRGAGLDALPVDASAEARRIVQDRISKLSRE